MLTAHHLTAQTLPLMEGVYTQFVTTAQDDFGWDMPALPWEYVIPVIESGELEGFILMEDALPEAPCVGFLLYRIEPHGAIEINLMHIDNNRVGHKSAVDTLIRFGYQHWLTLPDWQVISFAMLGKQSQFILTFPWYGFTPVGQAVVKLTFAEMGTLMMLERLKETFATPPVEGVSLHPFDKGDTNALAQLIYSTFHPMNDANWDPRFRTPEGCRQVVELITSNKLGEFQASHSLLAKQGETLVGFSLLTQFGYTGGNIPLIGVAPEHQGKKFGEYLLGKHIALMVEGVMSGELMMMDVSATMDTDHWPAVKMYRRLGFAEQQNYGHCYVPRTKVEQYKAGVWC